jgi:hypothetical protein
MFFVKRLDLRGFVFGNAPLQVAQVTATTRPLHMQCGILDPIKNSGRNDWIMAIAQ